MVLETTASYYAVVLRTASMSEERQSLTSLTLQILPRSHGACSRDCAAIRLQTTYQRLLRAIMELPHRNRPEHDD